MSGIYRCPRIWKCTPGRNGYAGLAGVEDGWINVCGLFRIDRPDSANGADLLPAYLEAGGNRRSRRRAAGRRVAEGSFSAVAGFELGRQTPVPGLLALGDAESMIPPFTGNGMSMAFQAAECAFGPLVSWSRGEQSLAGRGEHGARRRDPAFPPQAGGGRGAASGAVGCGRQNRCCKAWRPRVCCRSNRCFHCPLDFHSMYLRSLATAVPPRSFTQEACWEAMQRA